MSSGGQKIYFISDIHLGVPNAAASRKREKLLVNWLDEVKADAAEIFIVGDLFDFWFEYRRAVPKGFTRILGKLAEISDSGIPIHFFTGNHDLWMFGYFEAELGIQVYHEPVSRKLLGKDFFIGHGDGLGPGDTGYKWLKKLFRNPTAQWLYRTLVHPDIGIKLADYFSRRSRYGSGQLQEEAFLGEDKEWLVQYARRKLQQQHFDYFIFGHRHLPLDIELNENSRYINLGDWLSYFTYAEFDGQQMALTTYAAATAK